MRHYKKRPCPGGCGKVEQYGPQHLCQNCQRQLKLGKKREQEIAGFEADGERIAIAIDTRFGYCGTFLSFLSISHRDVLKALMRLAKLEDAQESGCTIETARPIHFKRSIPYNTRPDRFVWATPEQANDIELILDYIHLVIEKAYSDGQAKGRSLIRHLATAGVAELNKMTVEGKQS